MKKLLFFIVFIIMSFLVIDNVYADKLVYTVLTKYQEPNQPIMHYNSDISVKIPMHITHKKQEFRGVFVYTENNLDIEQSATVDEFKVQFDAILQTLKSYNMNAIIFQVRPMNDAIYSSDLNPWSRFLTGKEGDSLGWDPLTWMIKESHKQGISFHAGFNAFQVSNFIGTSKDSYLSKLSDANFAKQNPELVVFTDQNINGDIQLFLNPGEDKVKEFVLASIKEIYTKYNVDGITLDNYYYPTINFSNISDKKLYDLNNPDDLTLEDWRRRNITNLVSAIKRDITNYNKGFNQRVQFGTSVSGVWDNYCNNELGSNTLGVSSYEHQYTDTRSWVKKDYIDYIIPQVRWEFDHSTTKYADVVDWWNEVVKETKVNLYIGQYLYKYGSNLNWENPKEIPNHLKYNQSKTEVNGTLFYNYKSMIDEKNPPLIKAKHYIKTLFYNQIALNPRIPNVDSDSPKSLTHLFGKYVNNSIMLQWKHTKDSKEYIIYRFKSTEEVNLDDPSHILAVISGNRTADITYFDTDVKEETIYKYFITNVDKANNESVPVHFAINLAKNEIFMEQILIFTIVSILSISIITYTGVKVLKN